ncbi:MAG: conjugal transfer protein TraX [Defluviitaleaceae bacterium]|nr:conjugal transfer protein TraX [Defluviitaleaceae bacterium]
MSAFTLKIIALITMLIDHIGAIIPEAFGFEPTGINFFRVIGRVAFPIFAYLIAEGFRHTKNRGKFLTRLGIFALISEIPFDLALNENINFFAKTNIFYTLFLGGAAIITYEYIRGDKKTLDIFAFFPVIGFMWLANALTTDYGALGVAFIFCMYAVNHKKLRLAVMAFFCVLLQSFIVILLLRGEISNIPTIHLLLLPTTLIPVLLFAFYNGERGANFKWLFYIAYPAHLAVLAIL